MALGHTRMFLRMLPMMPWTMLSRGPRAVRSPPITSSLKSKVGTSTAEMVIPLKKGILGASGLRLMRILPKTCMSARRMGMDAAFLAILMPRMMSGLPPHLKSISMLTSSFWMMTPWSIGRRRRNLMPPMKGARSPRVSLSNLIPLSTGGQNFSRRGSTIPRISSEMPSSTKGQSCWIMLLSHDTRSYSGNLTQAGISPMSNLMSSLVRSLSLLVARRLVMRSSSCLTMCLPNSTPPMTHAM
mmetsp:Transcript_45454/g.144580  ORF Transcript_45454/g.144580 Transcript_45454/m.144580 type:complete len:242 (+) Transcript_45454:1144-1869(+)